VNLNDMEEPMAKTKDAQTDTREETTLTQQGSAQESGSPGAETGKLQGSQPEAHQQGREVQVGQGQQQGGAVQERRRQGLARYSRDPFETMQRLSEEMDELFDSFFYGRPLARGSRQSRLQSLWTPEVEVREEGNQLRVSVDLPGVSKDNVKVDVHDGMLTIAGERREEHSEGDEKQGFRRSERRYGSFYRAIALPEGAEAEQAQARMNEGVLEVTVPVTPPKQARRLEIQG
jgi:HSP20 family protein